MSPVKPTVGSYGLRMFIEYNPSINVINVSEVTIEVRHDLSAMKPLKIQ